MFYSLRMHIWHHLCLTYGYSYIISQMSYTPELPGCFCTLCLCHIDGNWIPFLQNLLWRIRLGSTYWPPKRSSKGKIVGRFQLIRMGGINGDFLPCSTLVHWHKWNLLPQELGCPPTNWGTTCSWFAPIKCGKMLFFLTAGFNGVQ